MTLGRLPSRLARLAMTATIASALVAYGCSDDAGSPADKNAPPSLDGSTNDATAPLEDASNASNDAGQDKAQEATPVMIAQLEPFEDGGAVGFAEVYANDAGVTLNVTIIGQSVPDGPHGIAIHQVGDCSASGDAAGSHWDVGDNPHALPSEGAHHLGDLGNIEFNGGFGALAVSDPRWTTDLDAGTSLLGRALILHADVDQGTSAQPSGASGARVSCGVIVTP